MKTGNLFTDATAPVSGERFDELLRQRNLTIERILSSSDITPTEYVQQQDEWVVLLRGEATLEVAGHAVTLRPGDHLFLPALTPHSVCLVAQDSLWLAIHLH